MYVGLARLWLESYRCCVTWVVSTQSIEPSSSLSFIATTCMVQEKKWQEYEAKQHLSVSVQTHYSSHTDTVHCLSILGEHTTGYTGTFQTSGHLLLDWRSIKYMTLTYLMLTLDLHLSCLAFWEGGVARTSNNYNKLTWTLLSSVTVC